MSRRVARARTSRLRQEAGGAASRSTRWLALALIAGTLALYAPVGGHDYLDYDDPLYISDNPQVQAGLTLAGLRWAFTTLHSYNWHPLTWLSLMADTELVGREPGPRHLVNVALHALSACLLFLFLARTTRAMGPSLVVSALFAFHPLNVQPVAWLAQRKDVLAALCFGLSLLAYARYVERPSPARYGTLALAYAAGLLAKPVLVTFPFVLLLLDYWPLRRWQPGSGGSQRALRLVAEKAPLFALALASSAVTFVAQQSGGAVKSSEAFPLPLRAANAVVAYVAYLGELLWPAALTIHHPYDFERLAAPAAQLGVVASLLVLGVVTALALRLGRTRPYLAVGWLWYLGMLLPMSGLVQVGDHALADRYAYLPTIGLLITVVFGVHDVALARGRLRLATALGVAACIACGAATAREISYWRNSETVFTRALAVTTDNAVAHYQLARSRMRARQPAAAIPHLREVLRLRPSAWVWKAHNELGNALAATGQLEAAVGTYGEAARLAPTPGPVLVNLGLALAKAGRLREALAPYREALAGDPELEPARLELANTLLLLGDAQAAVPHYEQLLARRPELEPALLGLGQALVASGSPQRALPLYERALDLHPGDVTLLNAAAVASFQAGRFTESAQRLEQAVRAAPERTDLRFNLARALAAAGRSDEATAQLELLLARDPRDAGARELLRSLRETTD